MKKLLKVLLIVMLCFSVVGCGSSDSSKSSTTDKKVKETEEERIAREYSENLASHKGYEAGVYGAGKDIKAGEYCLFANDLDDISNGYEVRKTEYDEGEDVLLDAFDFYTSYVNLKKGDFIEFEGAILYSVKDMPEIYKELPYVMLKVGKDIKAGNYLITPVDAGAYYEVTSPVTDAWGDRVTIISNAFDFKNTKKVKLKKGQYLSLENCTYKKEK